MEANKDFNKCWKAQISMQISKDFLLRWNKSHSYNFGLPNYNYES